MKTKTAKFMTIMMIAALSIFSAGNIMAAGNGDFYPQPPADSDWEKADTEGTYASYTNGDDYVNIYKYALDDVKTGIAKCNDTYEACYQTIYSEGNSLYMVVGYAKDADDIGEVRKFVEYISYPGNPALARLEDDKMATYSGEDSSDTQNASSEDTDNNGSDENSSDETSSSENTDTDQESQGLNDDTHYMGMELEQHDLQDSAGNSVTVTQMTNGDYYFRDADGTGFTDNGDGTWSDENGNSYTEMD